MVTEQTVMDFCSDVLEDRGQTMRYKSPNNAKRPRVIDYTEESRKEREERFCTCNGEGIRRGGLVIFQ